MKRPIRSDLYGAAAAVVFAMLTLTALKVFPDESSKYRMAALLILPGLMFGFLAWLGFKDGTATLIAGVVADRERHPRGFWAIQLFLLVFGVLLTGLALTVLVGSSPPRLQK